MVEKRAHSMSDPCRENDYYKLHMLLGIRSVKTKEFVVWPLLLRNDTVVGASPQ